MSWVFCLLKDSEKSQILLKISVIPILLTFIYLVALKSVNKQPTQLIIAAHNCHKIDYLLNIAQWIQ